MSPVARQWAPPDRSRRPGRRRHGDGESLPDNVCGACGDAFEDVASEQGVPVDVTHSTATVFIHENGSVTWVVINRVNQSAADQLAESPAALHRVAWAATTEGYGHPAGTRVPRTSVTASVDGRNVTLRFRERAASESRLGLTVAGTLHRGQRQGRLAPQRRPVHRRRPAGDGGWSTNRARLSMWATPRPFLTSTVGE